MMYKEKISIIVPVYNIENYLIDSINSLINQTYKNLEIILINDGSTDHSGAICDDYAKRDKRIRVFHIKNGGVSNARNVGLDNATGTYISFVDGDDTIEKDMIEFLYENIVEYNADIALTDFKLVYSNGIDLKKREKKQIFVSRDDILNMFLSGKILTNNIIDKLYKKEIIGSVRFKNYKIGEDMYFLYEVLKNTQKLYIDTSRAHYNYIVRENSAMTTSFNDDFFDVLILSEKIVEDCKNTKFYNVAKARLVNAKCKVLEYMYLKNAGAEYFEKKDSLYRDIKEYKLIEGYRYLSLRKFLGLLLMKISPKLYICTFKKVEKIK